MFTRPCVGRKRRQTRGLQALTANSFLCRSCAHSKRRSRRFWKPSSELLSLAEIKTVLGKKPIRKILRRMEQIEKLPSAQQAILPRTIDTFIKAASK
jgi:hypothetical protein